MVRRQVSRLLLVDQIATLVQYLLRWLEVEAACMAACRRCRGMLERGSGYDNALMTGCD